MTTTASHPPLAGIGLKPMHAAALLAGEAAVDFLEVHAENFFSAGGPQLRMLDRVRERWPLSVHGVGLSLGGSDALSLTHLDRLAALLQRSEPRWFSEHLAWSSHAGTAFNDLLPLPYTRATLQRVCDHIDQTQAHLGRRLLLENPSTYVSFRSSTMDEGQFLAAVVQRTGCGVLLDVNNAYVSGINQQTDPWALIEALPLGCVGEIHLAGHAEERDAAGDPLLIDNHGAPVCDAVWWLYQRTLERFGPVPTLIERDTDIPPLTLLAAEAARARALQQRAAEVDLVPARGTLGQAVPVPGRCTDGALP